MNRAHEHALMLLKKGKDDAYLLSRCIEDPMMPAWTLGFHAQQAVEKALKAVLADYGVEYPRTHSLALLLDLIQKQDATLPPDAFDLPRLTPFGVLLRYDEEPDESEQLAFDRRWALECVRRTLEWAEKLLAERKGEHP
jgi:HEPN domain-containing protein